MDSFYNAINENDHSKLQVAANKLPNLFVPFVPS